jgi:hypothetical protein
MASVTIVGSGFTGATQCFFGSTAVPITTMNSAGTSFICTPPAGSGGVTIGITGSNGTVSKSSGYTYVGSPTITLLGISSRSPGFTSGSTAGGTLLRIYGTNFYDRIGITFPGYYTGVSFGTVGLTADIFGITLSYVITPVSSVVGPVSFKLKTPTGDAIGLTFTYANYCTRVRPPVDDVLLWDNYDVSIGNTFSCLDNLGDTSKRFGCNCTQCCDALCNYTGGLCCDIGYPWNTDTVPAGCAGQVLAAIEDYRKNPQSNSNYVGLYCKHLVEGSCCVKFNIAGASYGVCLSPQGCSAECTDLVKYLYAGNSLTSPWNNSYTYNFVQGGNCSSCNPYCPTTKCLSGTTCENQCGPCCNRFGYCGDGCQCDTIPSPYSCSGGTKTWDKLACNCVNAIG